MSRRARRQTSPSLPPPPSPKPAVKSTSQLQSSNQSTAFTCCVGGKHGSQSINLTNSTPSQSAIDQQLVFVRTKSRHRIRSSKLSKCGSCPALKIQAARRPIVGLECPPPPNTSQSKMDSYLPPKPTHSRPIQPQYNAIPISISTLNISMRTHRFRANAASKCAMS